MENYIEDNRIHEGHRERMRSKLLRYGKSIFDTYELLEMLLYNVIPYKDTNPISKRLLAAFGSLDGVLSASKERLTEINGIGDRAAEFISLVGELSDVLGAEIINDAGPDFSSYHSVGEYLVDYFYEIDKKQVVALYLDSSMRLIAMEKLYDVEYESGGVKAKPFIDGAVRHRATVIISAHNHPFGPFYPSPGDRATNGTITDSLSLAGFLHAEHYLVSGDRYAGLGSLSNFNLNLSQMPAISDFLKGCDGKVNRANRVSAISKGNNAPLSNLSGYNSADLGYFSRLLEYAVGKRAGELADMLMRKYGTIENTMCASVRELVSLTDEKCAFYLKLLSCIASRRVTDGFAFNRIHTKAEIADYLKALFIGESVEKTYLLTFDEQEKITGCEILGEGTVCASEIMPRKAVEVAVSTSASSVAIAHNHPFGTTQPSTDDINLTKLFVTMFLSCEVKLKDHYIVAGQLCDTINFES